MVMSSCLLEPLGVTWSILSLSRYVCVCACQHIIFRI